MDRVRCLLLLCLLCAAGHGALALHCYQCSDVPITAAAGGDSTSRLPPGWPALPVSSVGFDVPKCTDFDKDDNKFKVTCVSPYNGNCAKVDKGKDVIRVCMKVVLEEQQVGEDLAIYLCTGDYCNGAALPSPPTLLLLLLPAALLVILATA